MIKFADEENELYFVNVSIPVSLIVLSIAVQVGFTAVTTSSYQDERIFPFSRKASAINVIVLISKTLTIAAPFVNELDEPIPIVVIIGL